MDRLSKGIEIEQFTGLPDGTLLPLSADLNALNPDFTVEPDRRNVEYVTSATCDYGVLACDLIRGRMKLREAISSVHTGATIVPGGCMAMAFERQFLSSKPEDPYHRHIANRHGLSVITTGIHYHIGKLGNPDEIIRIGNLLRSEAALILGLSAASPFYGGEITASQSYRWLSFPRVPHFMPLWLDHAEYSSWMKAQVQSESMFNMRHLWHSVRPNGPDKPEFIDRIEIRIADLMTDWESVLAIMAWIELRAAFFKSNPDLRVESHDESVARLFDENEDAAARMGLQAHFSDWLYEEETSNYEAIRNRLLDSVDMIDQLELDDVLAPIEGILQDGNEATQKIMLIERGWNIEQIVHEWIEECYRQDVRFESLCKIRQSCK